MKSASYQLLKKSSQTKARLGKLWTPHGEIDTPVFMPVGTQGTVKGVDIPSLISSGASIILANSYHLYLRPGTEIIKAAGGIAEFNSWRRPMLTDSGGFQIFSLNKMRKIKDDGVQFQSHIDGSTHFLSPQKSIKIQKDIGADIIMCFDECAPYPADLAYVKKAMTLSLDWAKLCKEEFDKDDDPLKQALFGIIQGGVYDDLRKFSAQKMIELDFNGYAIGGLSVG
ncbi:MAG: tRNA-guanine transglycosylase, partial [Elusimicrobiota bacterium]|nr:tRNA-guanine transglycosylase [Elusimicrobiota bacterium]